MIKPDKCDICETGISDAFVDGKTNMGPWANMCIKCYSIHGVGLGTGKGQRYHKCKSCDNFIKVEG